MMRPPPHVYGRPNQAGPRQEAPIGRIPPYDVDAEQSVLGALMLDQNAAAAIRDVLEPVDFHVEKHQHIYEAALALSDRAEPIDVVTLRAQLERMGLLARAGGVEYIAELSIVTPTAASVRYYAEIVAGHSLKRRLIQVSGKVAELGFDQTLEPSEALDKAEQMIYQVAESRKNAEASHISPLLKQTWSDLEAALGRNQYITGVRTNFSGLDNVTQGLQPGSLIILAARPSVGKTSFALNLARNAAVLAKVPVVIFSLEMSKAALVERLLCSEAHLDSFKLKTGQASPSDLSAINFAMDSLINAEIWIDDTPGLAISSLRSRARRLRSQRNIGLIVVDYLQLMHGGRQESRVQEVSDISSGLKSIAKELDIPVLALSQLSRESERRENRRPQLSDLRDSGSIEQDADVVLFLYREGMHNKDVDRSHTLLIVSKNRSGPTKDFELHFVAEQTAFREPDRVHTPPPGFSRRPPGSSDQASDDGWRSLERPE